MQIVFLVFCLIFGIFVILKSGDLLIDSALSISKNTGVGEQFIGLTLLTFATTAPELCVSCISATQGRAQMCVNNGLGSIICNRLNLVNRLIEFGKITDSSDKTIDAPFFVYPPVMASGTPPLAVQIMENMRSYQLTSGVAPE